MGKILCKRIGAVSSRYLRGKGENVVLFILKAQVPKDKKVTYFKIVCEVKPEKEEK